MNIVQRFFTVHGRLCLHGRLYLFSIGFVLGVSTLCAQGVNKEDEVLVQVDTLTQGGGKMFPYQEMGQEAVEEPQISIKNLTQIIEHYKKQVQQLDDLRQLFEANQDSLSLKELNSLKQTIRSLES